MSRAAYMREYRKRRKWSDIAAGKVDAAQESIRSSPAYRDQYADLIAAHERIAELEAEVARLKRELAQRTTQPGGFNTRPFTPVPKSGKR